MYLKSIGTGTFLWLTAAIFIKGTQPAIWEKPVKTFRVASAFAVAPLIAYSCVYGIQEVILSPGESLLEAVTIGLSAATILDGIAINNVPWLYVRGEGNYGKAAGRGLGLPASWLLWGVGWFLIAALHLKN